ncbi:MAG: monovalent cation/H(+) antiporter subunit G [Arcanobacterium sp.]|nr:monovalent cation/H(+) antiporter subunit G [Arcanobacterium sp.]
MEFLHNFGMDFLHNLSFDWAFFADFLGGTFIVVGTIFILIAAIGILRYPDLLSRQHVVTKPQVFSLIMFLLGVILLVRETTVTWTLLIVIAFQLISSPISAHILSRAGYRTGRVQQIELEIDELGEDMRTGDDTGVNL